MGRAGPVGGRHWRAADDGYGGARFLPAVRAQLRTVAHDLPGRPATAHTTRPFAVVADLAGPAGWMSHDAGHFVAAQQYRAFGVMAARRAALPGRTAELVSRTARQVVYFGHPADALDLIDIADRGAGKPPDDRLRAMPTAQRGRMPAATGHARPARYLLARAGDLLAAADQRPEPVPDWIAYVTPPSRP